MKTKIAFPVRNIFNGPKPTGKPYFTFKNQEDSSKPVDILIYEQIGKDWWSNEGVAAKDFVDELKLIPLNRQINVFINSPGGNVFDGLAIYNQLKARREMVTCYVDGVAASIASIIALAGKKLVMPENALMMIHDPSGLCAGTAEEMRQMADALDVCKNSLVSVYVEKTGKPKSKIEQTMTDETWFTGQDALDFGLCDETSSPIQIAACVGKFDLTDFKKAPNSLVNAPNASSSAQRSTQLNVMTRIQIIAMLKRHNIAFQDSATDAELTALLEKIPVAQNPPTPPAVVPPVVPAPSNAAELAEIKAQNKRIEDQLAKERKTRIEALVRQHVIDNRLQGNEVDDAVARCMADETYLDVIAKRPVVLPGEAPVSVMLESASPQDIGKGIMATWGKGIQTIEDTKNRSLKRAGIIRQNMAKLIGFMNTNTVSADLKRTVILQEMIRAFAIKILPLNAWSTVFNGVRLEGTDKVAVPYFPLITTTSIDFVAGTGYTTAVNSNSDAKTITVDKRKFQMLQWTSAEMARQPLLNTAMAKVLAAEQLAVDAVNDILSIVLTAAFPNAVAASPASAFDSDDVADVKGACDLLNWPASGRSLILNSAYDVNLLKDQNIKNAFAFGDNAPIREGRIVRLLGFDYYPDARIPANGELLQGFACYKSAGLVAFSPVEPTPDVRAVMTSYEIITDPESGAQFEYRQFGDAVKDQTSSVIETNYGKLAGEAAALGRITSS